MDGDCRAYRISGFDSVSLEWEDGIVKGRHEGCLGMEGARVFVARQVCAVIEVEVSVAFWFKRCYLMVFLI